MTRVKAAVVGGMNLDCIGQAARDIVLRDSNIGRVRLSPGGVGRNIACGLARLGAETELITFVGDDAISDMLARACEKDGISLAHAVRGRGGSGAYLSVHEMGGDMLAAVNDTRSMRALTPDAMRARIDALNGADVCVLDANLPADTLAFLAENVRAPLLADPVSCAKSARLAGVYARLTAVKPNLWEARAMTGRESASDCARALLRQGVKMAFISLGEDGLYYADEAGQGHIGIERAVACQTTGAGDALCAGIAMALATGARAEACARAGMDACRAFLKEREANNDK